MDPENDRKISDHVLRMHRYRKPGEQEGEGEQCLENLLQAAVFDCYESLGKFFKAIIYNIHYDLFWILIVELKTGFWKITFVGGRWVSISCLLLSKASLPYIQHLVLSSAFQHKTLQNND